MRNVLIALSPPAAMDLVSAALELATWSALSHSLTCARAFVLTTLARSLVVLYLSAVARASSCSNATWHGSSLSANFAAASRPTCWNRAKSDFSNDSVCSNAIPLILMSSIVARRFSSSLLSSGERTGGTGGSSGVHVIATPMTVWCVPSPPQRL